MTATGLLLCGRIRGLGIDIDNPIIVNESTGTCVSIVTPDADAHHAYVLSRSEPSLGPAHRRSAHQELEWLFIEGYVFANPDAGQTAVREAIPHRQTTWHQSRHHCSEAFVPQVFADAFHDALQHTDLLFCNEAEACAVAQGPHSRGKRLRKYMVERYYRDFPGVHRQADALPTPAHGAHAASWMPRPLESVSRHRAGHHGD